jgi:hypothetical protein
MIKYHSAHISPRQLRIFYKYTAIAPRWITVFSASSIPKWLRLTSTQPFQDAALSFISGEQFPFSGISQYRTVSAFFTTRENHPQNPKQGGTMHIQIFVNSLPVEGKAYQAGEGLIVHIPAMAQKTGEEPELLPPFSDLFQPVSSGFIEVGEWDGKAYEFEGGVELVQGPDGKVWAQVCELADLPSAEPPAGTMPCPQCRGSGVTRHEDDANGRIFTGRCSQCWGTGVIPSWEPSREGDIVFALGYWDCECERDYIHPDNHDHCAVCGAVADDQPASRAVEVQEYLASFGLAVEL